MLIIINRGFPALLLFIASGCMPLAPRVYMPAASTSQIVAGRMCEPAYKTSLFDKNGLAVSLVLTPRSEIFVGSIQLDVPSGTSFQMQSDNIQIDALPFQVPIQAKLASGRYAAKEKIEGYALAEFTFGIKLPSLPDELTLTLPKFEINGLIVDSKPLLFVLRRQLMVVGICQ